MARFEEVRSLINLGNACSKFRCCCCKCALTGLFFCLGGAKSGVLHLWVPERRHRLLEFFSVGVEKIQEVVAWVHLVDGAQFLDC